jgi:hypothetical protein
MHDEVANTPRDDNEFIDSEAITAGARPFAPGEMIACPACRRNNAPTRMKCLYCGATLPVAAGAPDLRRPALRPLEAGEQGFNVVLLARAETADALPVDALNDAAALLRLEPGQMRQIVAARTPLPLARTALHEEAVIIERKLAPLGLTCEIVPDEVLAVEAQWPRRVRRFEFTPDALVAWARADDTAQALPWSEIILLVAGRISRRQIEVEELRKRGKSGTSDTREFHADEAVLDIYAGAGGVHLRVIGDTFDYTCLGAEKSLLAAENFSRLVAALDRRATNAVFDGDYATLRHLLQTPWPVAEQTGAGGVRRTRPGRVYTEAVTSISNEAQFARYSRLRRHFILRARS